MTVTLRGAVSADVPAAEPLALLETFQAVLRSLRSVIISQRITTERELDDMLGELEDAKTASLSGRRDGTEATTS